VFHRSKPALPLDETVVLYLVSIEPYTTRNSMASPVTLPNEVLTVIASYWDGCIDDAKQACLASRALCELYQPLMFRVVEINEEDPSITERIDNLLDAVTSNPSLARLVRELEWTVDWDSHSPDIPRLLEELQYLASFRLKNGTSSQSWEILSKQQQQTITNLCRRPTLQALSICDMFYFPSEIIFNPSLKIESLCVKDTHFFFSSFTNPHGFVNLLQSVTYLTSLRHIEAAYMWHGARPDEWVQPVVQAAASSGSLRVLSLNICPDWRGCK